MTAKVLIIMPAYNEAMNLPHVLPELRKSLTQVDVVVVNDCSRDDTANIARELGAQVVSLPCNLGYGGAVQTGYKYAVENDYDLAVMLDADGQHDPACVLELMAPVLAGDTDVAIGSRFLGRMEYRTTWTRRLGMRLFGGIVALLTGKRITDPTSGFQALNREVLTFFANDNYPSDYPDADVLLLLHYAGFRFIEVPVCMRERIEGVSMHGKPWKALYYIVKMVLSLGIIFLRQTTHSSARRPSVQTGARAQNQ